ncbi:DUF4167 domain-containing protein [Amylibacter sp. SFDW26]|uniref:DUF4167 domain-containing protein n=1 Tax=Amylibacter sp. SFDW26 TaxID=2652722 RepID=UPI001261A2FC|nr:DUF4167 domain-containing protein [Amylibacter sp. SFDW26]KAB7615815.1 DUF4167 domain-containing protein [Amylibacter sp. SFDW26]
MRSSNKSRSRNKNNNNNRRGNPANVVNRVFDSSGPEGKVRGTPQQIIDKYQSLSSDAMLSGDRVNAENFLQHSEHYSRLLTEAQREMNERREAQEAQRQQQQQKQQNQQKQKAAVDASEGDQPDVAGNAGDVFPAQADNNLVDTPETKKKPSKAKKPVEKKIKLAEPEAEPKAAPAKNSAPDTAAE